MNLSGHGGRDEDSLWAQEHGRLLAKADLAVATAEGPISQKQRPTPRPLCGTIPGAIGQLPGGRLVTLGRFHHGRGGILSLLE